jgi:hypothetical protein
MEVTHTETNRGQPAIVIDGILYHIIFPNKGKSPYSTIEDIKINSKGVHKLLKNLKPHKATGPDSIPSCVLKAAVDQLAPILTE